MQGLGFGVCPFRGKVRVLTVFCMSHESIGQGLKSQQEGFMV